MRDDEQARRATADATFAWVHVADLASLAADLASGRIPDAPDPASGPVAGRAHHGDDLLDRRRVSRVLQALVAWWASLAVAGLGR
jgi:hypothetical protein